MNLKPKKQRLDLELVARNLTPTRSQAQTLIRSGQVIINDQKAISPSQLVNSHTVIKIIRPLKYVSRGGLKLEHALKKFNIDPTNKICLDIGSSTGGFTDCLLQHGAYHVYALDVGTNQLTGELKKNPHVTSLEQTHFLHLTKLPNPNISLITIDVSFISSKKILSHLIKLFENRYLKIENSTNNSKNTLNKSKTPIKQNKLTIINLLKPQFETAPYKNFKGVVKDPAKHQQIIKEFIQFCQEKNIQIINQSTSPIKGPKGNIEFLFHLSLG